MNIDIGKSRRFGRLRGACGFTLIELLTTIAVIAILAGLILAGLAKAKERAQAARCESNTRQLLLAWTMYAADDKDALPPNVDGMASIPAMRGVTDWVAGNMRLAVDATNAALLVNGTISLLAPYLKSAAAVFKCPGDKSSLVRSCSMNCRMNPFRPDNPPRWIQGAGTNYVNFRKSADIGRPSEMFVFTDERSDSINDGYFAVDMSNTGTEDGQGGSRPYYIIDYPASYHNGAGCVSFADGHAEIHRWVEGTTKPPLGEAEHAVYTSPHDRDVKWLQDHSTYRR